jgi:hypothetical protein
VELKLRREDIELYTTCATRGAKNDLYFLQVDIASSRWTAPTEPIEPGIWKIPCSDHDVIFYFVDEVMSPTSRPKLVMRAYSISLVKTADGDRCSAVTHVQALRTARRLRKSWGVGAAIA